MQALFRYLIAIAFGALGAVAYAQGHGVPPEAGAGSVAPSVAQSSCIGDPWCWPEIWDPYWPWP